MTGEGTQTDGCATQISDPEALADFVRHAGQQKTPIVDYGIAHTGLGHPPPDEHFRLELRGTVLEHYDRDMAVCTSTGIGIAHLQSQLASDHQFLPIDADDDLTLGEVISHNVYGPLRVSYGSVRDLLLGLHYVDGYGCDIHVGGRTVKNVAGYDLTRFMVGGLGQFGIVHEATIRTYAIPEQVDMVTVQVQDPTTIDNILPGWLLTDATPTHIQLQRANGDWTLHLAYFGSPKSCSIQLHRLESQLEGVSGLCITDTRHGDLVEDHAHRAGIRSWRRKVPALVKVIVPPRATGSTCRALADWARQDGPELSIDAMPVHGCVFAGGELEATAIGKLDQEISRIIQSVNGLRVWYSRPAGGQTIEPFGPPQNDWPILTALKLTMDPQNLFNPERFIRLESRTS